MEWKDVADTVKTYAPGASALCKVLSLIPGVGTVAAGAQLGIDAITGALGLSSSSTPQEVKAAIQADPQAAFKIMQAENDYKLAVMKEDTRRLELQLNDVQSARTMNTETTKVTGKRDFNLYFLAYLYTVGFFVSTGVMVYLAMQSKLPSDMPQAVIFLLGNLFGCLTAGVTAILQYFFGSSKGSSDKTDLLAKADAIKD